MKKFKNKLALSFLETSLILVVFLPFCLASVGFLADFFQRTRLEDICLSRLEESSIKPFKVISSKESFSIVNKASEEDDTKKEQELIADYAEKLRSIIREIENEIKEEILNCSENDQSCDDKTSIYLELNQVLIETESGAVQTSSNEAVIRTQEIITNNNSTDKRTLIREKVNEFITESETPFPYAISSSLTGISTNSDDKYSEKTKEKNYLETTLITALYVEVDTSERFLGKLTSWFNYYINKTNSNISFFRISSPRYSI